MATPSSSASFPSDPVTASLSAEESLSAAQKLREQADAVVQRLRPKLDAVSTFAREEPTKALLIAAAAGAAIIGVIALMARSGRRAPAPVSRASSAMTTIRDAALDLADRAHSAAANALDGAHARATSAADTVSDSVSDAWKSLREQAGPVVDKLRPQIDAVANYAKEDPARAAVGIAAVGAALVGLLALIRHSESD